jgi:hypothetical protein
VVLPWWPTLHFGPSAFFSKVILHIGIKRINVTSAIGLLVGSGPCIREVGGNAGAPFAHPMGRASPPTLQLLRLNEGSTHSINFLSTLTFFCQEDAESSNIIYTLNSINSKLQSKVFD